MNELACRKPAGIADVIVSLLSSAIMSIFSLTWGDVAKSTDAIQSGIFKACD